jgi:hypothetical protein
MEEAIENFVNRLLTVDLIENPLLFDKMDLYARNHGFKLCAYQRGIRGTYICFERMR